MIHWRKSVIPPSPNMILWRRCVAILSGFLIGAGLALLVWGLR